MSGYFSPTTRNSFLYWEFFYRNLEQTWRRLQLARSLMKSPHYKKNQDLRVTNSLQNFRKPLQRWCLRWLPVTRKTREGNWFAMAFVDYYKFSDGFVICKVLRWLCHPLRFMTLSPIKNCGGFVIHKKFATNFTHANGLRSHLTPANFAATLSATKILRLFFHLQKPKKPLQIVKRLKKKVVAVCIQPWFFSPYFSSTSPNNLKSKRLISILKLKKVHTSNIVVHSKLNNIINRSIQAT